MKINLAWTELPEYRGLRTRGYELGQTGGVHIGPSIDYLQRAYEDARQGRPADYPFFAIHAQSAVDRTLAPGGQAHALDLHPVLPLRAGRGHLGRAPRRDRQARPRPLRRVRAEHGRRRDHGAGAGPARHRSPLRPDRRPHLPGRAGAGAGLRHAPRPGLADVRGPDPRPLPVRLRRLAGRLRHGRAGPQRRPRGDRAASTRRSSGCGRGSTSRTSRQDGKTKGSKALAMRRATLAFLALLLGVWPLLAGAQDATPAMSSGAPLDLAVMALARGRRAGLASSTTTSEWWVPADELFPT